MSERSDFLCELCGENVLNSKGWHMHRCNPAPSAVEAKGEPSLGQKLIEAASECLEPNAPAIGFACVDQRNWTFPSVSGPPKKPFHMVPGICSGCAYQKLERELAAANREINVLKNMVKKTSDLAEEQLNASVDYQFKLIKEREKVAGLSEACRELSKYPDSELIFDQMIEALTRFGDGKL